MKTRQNKQYKYIKSSLIITQIIISLLAPSLQLSNECGIQFCSSCNPSTNFCYQCDLPYKPGYKNQTICTRCHNNCAVCQKPGNNSQGICLSCEPNFNFQTDNTCETFYVWVYVVTIASYVVYAIILILIFCYIKRKRQNKQNFWYQNLKKHYNNNVIENSPKISQQQFNKKCQQLQKLILQCSSKNNIKFKDRYFEKQIKIKQIKIKQIKNQKNIKTLYLKGYDNSQWQGNGYVYLSRVRDQNNQQINIQQINQDINVIINEQRSINNMKLWFYKVYNNKVYSQELSKVLVYESLSIRDNQINGKWYYYQRPDINGTWYCRKK